MEGILLHFLRKSSTNLTVDSAGHKNVQTKYIMWSKFHQLLLVSFCCEGHIQKYSKGQDHAGYLAAIRVTSGVLR